MTNCPAGGYVQNSPAEQTGTYVLNSSTSAGSFVTVPLHFRVRDSFEMLGDPGGIGEAGPALRLLSSGE